MVSGTLPTRTASAILVKTRVLDQPCCRARYTHRSIKKALTSESKGHEAATSETGGGLA